MFCRFCERAQNPSKVFRHLSPNSGQLTRNFGNSNFASVNKSNGLAEFSRVDSTGNPVTMAAMEGLLLYSGKTVCDRDFDDNSAEVICRYFGYSGKFSWSSGSKWKTQHKYNINQGDFQCNGGDWSSCSLSPPSSGRCYHNDDVFLTCSGQFGLLFLWSYFSNNLIDFQRNSEYSSTVVPR